MPSYWGKTASADPASEAELVPSVNGSIETTPKEDCLPEHKTFTFFADLGAGGG